MKQLYPRLQRKLHIDSGDSRGLWACLRAYILILTPEQPSQTTLNTFRTQKVAHQDYTVIGIDTTAFENGGILTINIQVGKDKGIGIFYLLDGDKKLPSETPPDGIDSDVWNDQQSDEYKMPLPH